MTAPAETRRLAPVRPIRVGFLGFGWIGRKRMEQMAASGCIEVAAIADLSADRQREAASSAPEAACVARLDDLLEVGVEGVVIATPNAHHAEQSIRALQAGAAVFCQKPLGCSADEVRKVIEAARTADRLLAVDFSYRFTEGMQRIREQISSGALGRVFALDLVFHNAYGPDKVWYNDRSLSGGGCLMDLGVHLIDSALWLLNFPRVVETTSSLIAGAEPFHDGTNRVEDYAVATLQLEGGIVSRLACSWRLHAGCDALISVAVHGTRGGAVLYNVDGSFYDFRAEFFVGRTRSVLATPPDDWGGRAAVDWAQRVAGGQGFDRAAERLEVVAEVLDSLYGRDDSSRKLR